MAVAIAASALALTPGTAHAAVTVSGLLELPNGDPATAANGVEFAGVNLQSDDGFGFGVAADPTTGSWSVDLEPGDYSVVGGAPGIAQYASSQEQSLTVTASGFTLPANPRLQASTISGVVEHADGSTAHSGWIDVWQGDQYVTTTFLFDGRDFGFDAGGVFSLALPVTAGDDYELTAFPTDDGTAVFSAAMGLDPSIEHHNLTLAFRTGNVLGTVLEPGGGAAVPGGQADLYTWPGLQHVGWAMANDAGDFALLAPGDGEYGLRVQPPFGNNPNGWSSGDSVITITTGAVSAINGVAHDGTRFGQQLENPNVTGTVTGPNGEALTWGSNVDVERTTAGGGFEWVTSEQLDDQGTFRINVDDGTYRLRANAPWENPSNWTSVTIEITVAGGVLTSPAGPLTLALRAPNVAGTILDPNGDPVGRASVQVQDSNGHWLGMWANANDSGVFGLSLEDGSYTLVAEPGWGQDLPWARGSVDIVVSGGSVTSPAGALTVSMRAPNVSGTVVRPASTTPVRDSQVEIFNTGTNQPVDGGWDHTGDDGTFAFAVADGTYEITARPPWSDPDGMAPASVDVVVAGGVVTTVAGAAGSSPFQLALRTPNVLGTVFQPGTTTAAPGAQIEVRDATTQMHEAWTQTNSNGEWSVHLENGTYEVTARPPWNDTNGWVQQTFTITVSGGNVTVVEAPGSLAGGRAVVALRSSNVSGTVLPPSGSTGVSDSWISIIETASGHWVDAWAMSGSSGGFGLFLADGAYTVTAEPPYDNPSGWAPGTAQIVVGGGQLTTVNGASATTLSLRLTTPNVSGTVTAGGSGTDAWIEVRNADTGAWHRGTGTRDGGAYGLSLGTGTWRLTAFPGWSAPSGYVQTDLTVTVDGGGVATPSPANIAMRGANVQGTVLAGGTGLNDVNIEVRHADTGQWVEGAWAWTQTRGNEPGKFSLFLDDGSYTLTARPGWNNPGNHGVTSQALTVDGDELVTINLASSNVSGTITAPGGATVRDSNVYVTTSDGMWVENGWGNTNQSGVFSLTLADGTYTLHAQPPYWTTDTWTRSSRSITVNGGILVGGADLQLGSPNVTGTVKNPAGSATVAYAHIEVEKDNDCVSGGDDWIYTDRWADTRANGTFGMSLSDCIYRLTIRPPWNDQNGWAPRKMTVTVAGSTALGDVTLNAANFTGVVSGGGSALRDVWIDFWNVTDQRWLGWAQTKSDGSYGIYIDPADLGDAGTANDGDVIQISAYPPWNSTAGWVRSQVQHDLDDAVTLNVTLTTGNVAGRVLGAGSSTAAIQGSWVSAERRISDNGTPDDSSDDIYTWVDAWGTSRSDGAFSLNLPGTAQTERYLLRAHPSWHNPNGWVAGTKLIDVGTDGTVTVVGGGALDIRLQAGNISGFVYRLGADTPVANAMVDIRRNDGGGFDGNGTVVDVSATTSSTGAFSLSLPAGTYRVRAMPPASSTGLGSGSFQEVTVTDTHSWTLRLGS